MPTLNNLLAYICSECELEEARILKEVLAEGMHSNEYAVCQHILIDSHPVTYNEPFKYVVDSYFMQLRSSSVMQIIGTHDSNFFLVLQTWLGDKNTEYASVEMEDIARPYDFRHRSFNASAVKDMLLKRIHWSSLIHFTDSESIANYPVPLHQMSYSLFQRYTHKVSGITIDDVYHKLAIDDIDTLMIRACVNKYFNGDLYYREDYSRVANSIKDAMFNFYNLIGEIEECERIQMSASSQDEVEDVDYTMDLRDMPLERVRNIPITRALELYYIKKHLDIGGYDYSFTPNVERQSTSSTIEFKASDHIGTNPSYGFTHDYSSTDTVPMVSLSFNTSPIKDTTVYTLIIRYESLTIRNVHGGTHEMKNLFVRMRWSSIRGFSILQGMRTSLSKIEIDNAYAHSHLPSTVGRDYANFQDFCEGSSEIVFLRTAIHEASLTDESTLDIQVGGFFHAYDMYIVHETDTGTPYKRITDMYTESQDSNTAIDERQYFRTMSSRYTRRIKEQLSNLIQFMISSNSLKFMVDWNTGGYEVEYLRSVFRRNVSQEDIMNAFATSFNALTEHRVFVQLDTDGRLLKTHNRNGSGNYTSFVSRAVGELAIKFRGDEFRIAEVNAVDTSIEDSFQYEINPYILTQIINEIKAKLQQSARSYYRSTTASSLLYERQVEDEDQSELSENSETQLLER